MISHTPVKLGLLGSGWRGSGIALRDLVPERLYQLKLVFHIQLARFVKQASIHKGSINLLQPANQSPYLKGS